MDLGRPLSTVTPTLDGDVLAVLANHDAIFTTGQLHRVLPRHSEEGIRKVLRRLTKQGVVLADRVGNAFAYRLNRDHLAAEHIVGLAQLQKALLKRIEERLGSWRMPPVYAAIFGSAARGSMTAESDIDLLLVRPDDADENQWEAQVDALVTDMSRWVGNDIRPLEFTAGEVISRGHDEPVLRDVVRDGLTVLGSRAWLARQSRETKT
ncbi:nucleotidyltransferase domain-containing protein [Amycolatopsis sp. NPDC059027]|uniref:nucleotidyltransferase domain-containing protein n=1 Tax=unclassified Amycolatopsis TaxID=2618356 RepID=UPI0036705CBD